MTDNTKRQKFGELVREMFQLNQPELDFGIYRIMHARKDDINRFIESDLPRIVDEAFSGFESQNKLLLQQELEKAKKAAEAAGITPEQSPKVKELESQLKGALDLGREEGEVYDALITFFSRYYDEGDFISRRVYKDGTYAIPYNGEEVVLHWANKDQYYIKSSETLRDFSFRLDPNNEDNPMRVHFRLVDAEAGAQNNNKETETTKRVFVLDTEQPWEQVSSSDPAEQGKELNICFHFRTATAADWTAVAKKGATAAAAKKPPTQDHLRQIAVERLLGEGSDLHPNWKKPLSQAYTKANGEKADYPILQGQLNNYTKKNTFDYFIHKELGAFFTRELDFYIKNELLRWEDVAALTHQPAQLAPLLSKIEVIRTIGEKIIAFLAQLEEFQKKLWLKKKFVTETHYCVTLDRLEGNEKLLEEIFANKRQREQWAELYALDLKKLDKDCKKLSSEALLARPEYRFLMVDTTFFDKAITASLLGVIDDLNEKCNGLMVHAENYHALSLLQDRYREQVKCIYIDPPYNTDSSSIPYKNNYKHSSFVTLIRDRLEVCHPLLKGDGAIFVSIDKTERMVVEHALDDVFGSDNHIEELIWTQATANSQLPNYSTNHEYVEVYARDRSAAEADKEMFREPKPGYSEVMELVSKLNPTFPTISEIEKEIRRLFNNRKEEYQAEIEASGKQWNADAKRQDPWRGIYPYTNAEYRDENGVYIPESAAQQRKGRIWVWSEIPTGAPASKQSPTTKDPEHSNYRYYKPTHPVTGKPCPHPQGGWKFPFRPDKNKPKRRSFESLEADKRIAWGSNENKVPRTKGFLHEVETNIGTSVFYEYNDGEAELNNLFGSSGLFLSPKSSKFVKKFILQATKRDSIFADYFGGTGSSSHALLQANREDGGNRKFITVEMGAYFDLLTKPRILKAHYASEWKEGSPKSRDGVSGLVKVVRLESYEDALANLRLERDHPQQELLASQSPDDQVARESYLLNYMLDVETRGSDSLLNVVKFVDPTQYQLMVRNPSGDETKLINVDLLETFNWLIGLEVEYIAAPIHFDAELSQAEHGRWQAKVKRAANGRWWFRTVTGVNRKGQKILIVWRNLPSVIDQEENGLIRDNAVLDAVLIDKLKVRMTESPDDEFDLLYVNGDHNVSIPKRRDGGLMEARVKLIEEDFHRLMFSTETQ